jgi:hypothetical protein
MGRKLPNDRTIYQMAIKHKKWLQNGPNGPKLYQHFLFQGPPKFTQTGIFGSKMRMPSGSPGARGRGGFCRVHKSAMARFKCMNSIARPGRIKKGGLSQAARIYRKKVLKEWRRQGDQIRSLGDCLLWAVFWEIAKVA